MKIKLFFITIFSCFVFLSNCTKDEIDLTVHIVGVYKGIDPTLITSERDSFEVIVAKISKDTISVAPNGGNEFEKFERKLVQESPGQIKSPDEFFFAFTFLNPTELEFGNSFVTGISFRGDKQD